MPNWLIGIDEAGRGPVIGPMIQAAVLFSEHKIPKLKDIGVKDSKKLTRKKREELYNIILDGLADQIIVENFSAEQITSLMEKKVSLNEIEALGLENLLKKASIPEGSCHIIVDQFDKRKSFIEGIIRKTCPNCVPKVLFKADDLYIVCGAASIIAKCQRDWSLEKIIH